MRNSAASHPVQYSLNPNGTFVIENYNQAPAFSSFFPGIAGLWGIPMWVFYVNRGQGICSFGIESKDKSILEFQPASKAYRLTSSEGFRTFLKIRKDAQAIFHEPFRDQGHRTTTRMLLTSHDLTLEEVFPSLGLVTRVNYFTMPEEPYAALVRRLTLENVSKKKYDIELVDGLPVIIPYGASDWLLKNMSRTLEAWVEVENLNKRVPYYHLKVEVNDRPTTTRIHEGNFYLGFDATASPGKLLEPVVETSCIFGSGDDFSSPQGFLKQKRFTPPTRQKTANRMPSAMVFHHFVLGPQAKREITSLIGHAPGISWTHRIARQVLQKGFIEKKSEHNRAVISEIKNFALTNSSSQPLNQYSTQTFLDNVLRGGLPISFRTKEGEVIFNVFSRKHGDLERDYNFFVLKPTYFSQGNGNYRDINQNRRNDVWFNPHIKDQHLLSFINLLKADGYNPLILKGVNFWLEDRNVIETLLSECVREKNHDEIRALLIKGFQPGELLKKITRDPIPLKIKPQEFLERILGLCHKREIVEHGDGYWTDHWTYNLDLIESFLSLYPDELDNFLLQKKYLVSPSIPFTSGIVITVIS